MAYNSYYPATYQPMYYPQQIQPQQQIQPSSLIWVTNITEAQSYPVAPNNAVALWDASSPAIYLKQADASGRPTLKIFDIVERSAGVSQSDGKGVEYAAKSELDALSAALESIRGELETMRGDIYGLAGKRKKKEVEDE